jgi:hypothetical protein|tara:strand:+ start:208 stop:663 length:456 start_codon:yes stop_codon:yes gene_type:complete
MKDEINISEFSFNKSVSIKIHGFTGHQYINNKNKKNLFLTPSGDIERDIVRNFISQIKIKNISYIENYSVNNSLFQRPRRLDFIFIKDSKIFLIDVIKKDSEKMKVIRKINDQLNEIKQISEVIILIDKNNKDTKVSLDLVPVTIIKYNYE